jgi:ribulose-5-phosphate 4-epimerase/fuculose-1-phosphate aldolase
MTLRDRVSDGEWQTRVDLAAAYRIVAMFGWDDLVYTHISARVDGAEDHFLINRYGLLFDEITASSLVKVDLAGRAVMPEDADAVINPAGFTIHGAIHAARANARCIVHTHTRDGVAVSAQRHGLLPISQQALFVLTGLGHHPYEGLVLTEAEQPRLVANLGAFNYLLLHNHGLLTVADTIPDAVSRMYLFESACAIQIRAAASGTELIAVDDTIRAGIRAAAAQATRGTGPGGKLAWPGLLRRLDRLSPSYRT